MNKNFSPTVDQAKAALAGVQSMFQDLLKQRETLQAKRLEIFGAREALLVQPFSKAEVLQAMCEVVDMRAKEHGRKVQAANLLDLMTHPTERGQGYPRPNPNDLPLALCDLLDMTSQPRPYARNEKDIAPRPALLHKHWSFPILLNEPAIKHSFQYFFLGDLIKKKLCELLAGNEDGVLLENGLPNAQSLEERRAKVDELSQQLQKIDLELEALQQDIDAVTKPVLNSAQALRDS